MKGQDPAERIEVQASAEQQPPEGGDFTPAPATPFRQPELGETPPPHNPPSSEAAESARRIMREKVEITDGGLLQRDASGAFIPETMPGPGEVVVEPLNHQLLLLEELSVEALQARGGPVNANVFNYIRRPECVPEFLQYAEEVREHLRPNDIRPPGNVCGAKYHLYGQGDERLEVIAIIAPNFNAGPWDAQYAGCGDLPVEYFKAKDLPNGSKGVTPEQELHAIHALKVMYKAIFDELLANGKKKIRMAPVASGNNAGNFSKRMGRLTITALLQVFEDMSDDQRTQLLDPEASVSFCIFPDFNKPGRRLKFLQEQHNQTSVGTAPATWDHYEFVLDDSASMQGQRDAVISGFNKFVENVVAEQSATQRVTFALQKFGANATVENNPSFEAGNDILQLEPLDFTRYNPSYGTPLHAAIVTTIEINLPAKLALLGGQTPNSVNVIVLTDGQDSSPLEFRGQETFDRMHRILAEKRAVAEGPTRWFFTYMGEGNYVNSGPGIGFQEDELFRYLQSSVFRGFDNAAREMRGRRRGDMGRDERDELQRQANSAGGDAVFRGPPQGGGKGAGAGMTRDDFADMGARGGYERGRFDTGADTGGKGKGGKQPLLQRNSRSDISSDTSTRDSLDKGGGGKGGRFDPQDPPTRDSFDRGGGGKGGKVRGDSYNMRDNPPMRGDMGRGGKGGGGRFSQSSSVGVDREVVWE